MVSITRNRQTAGFRGSKFRHTPRAKRTRPVKATIPRTNVESMELIKQIPRIHAIAEMVCFGAGILGQLKALTSPWIVTGSVIRQPASSFLMHESALIRRACTLYSERVCQYHQGISLTHRSATSRDCFTTEQDHWIYTSSNIITS